MQTPALSGKWALASHFVEQARDLCRYHGSQQSRGALLTDRWRIWTYFSPRFLVTPHQIDDGQQLLCEDSQHTGPRAAQAQCVRGTAEGLQRARGRAPARGRQLHLYAWVCVRGEGRKNKRAKPCTAEGALASSIAQTRPL